MEPRFEVALPPSPGGLAAVVDDDGWAYIDGNGRIVIRPFPFDNGPDPFSEGRARFLRDGKFGFFDETGRIVIQPSFDFAEPFHEGMAAVCSGCRLERQGEHTAVVGGVWGFVDSRGRLRIPYRFDAASSFSGGHAHVTLNGTAHMINRHGQPVEASAERRGQR